MSSDSGLGKGLGSLFGTSAEDFSVDSFVDDGQASGDDELRDGDVVYVPVASIDTDPAQPRKDFNEERLQELADSIQEHGLLQPLLVAPLDNGRFRLLAGERRYRSARIAGLEEVPVVIRFADGGAALQVALIENIQREDLNPMEQARAMNELATTHGMSQADLAKRLAMPRSTVANYLRLVSLPQDVQELVAGKGLTMGHAKALLALEDPEALSALAKRVVSEGLSVRQTEELAQASKPQETEEAPSPKPRRRREVPPEFKEVQERMSHYLDAKVSILGNPKKGRISIEYASPEQLERICGQLSEQVAGDVE